MRDLVKQVIAEGVMGPALAAIIVRPADAHGTVTRIR
jgi:hypothetical protein